MVKPVLKVESLCKSFGGVRAIRDLSFNVNEGQILGLIGPNGSGKSTTVNSLAGLFPITSGAIDLAGTKSTHCLNTSASQEGCRGHSKPPVHLQSFRCANM